MTDRPRLIEYAFPLRQASLDSVHEKNVRHGHISTLHIWPARRPLAACRAALIATLLPDPGTPESRQELCERIGGKIVSKVEKKKLPGGRSVEREKFETDGGVLSWVGTEPKSGSKAKKKEHQAQVAHREEELAWFREQIKAAYGGRAPRVLDPFAGGGAIPLEAMRLGCEATAIDINPVAWFILKCTLDYPQQLAGKTHPLPTFILEDEDYMAQFYKAHPHLVGRTKKTKRQKEAEKKAPGLFDTSDSGRVPKANLAWHVRAWGRWVLAESRKALSRYYPTYAEFEPLDLKNPKPYERRPMRFVPTNDDGTPNLSGVNSEFSEEYLDDKKNPRWVAKPTVAYLWARTIQCKHCRNELPLLKTTWIARTDSQRVLLHLDARPNGGVEFRLAHNVDRVGGNNAQRREHDKRIGQGTMSRAGAKCPTCGVITTLEDIQVEGQSGRMSRTLTAVAVAGQGQKEFRLPTDLERETSCPSEDVIREIFADVPFGLPEEKLVEDAKRNTWCVQYGLDSFSKLFTERQLVALAVLIKNSRAVTEAAAPVGYEPTWIEAIRCYLACGTSRLEDFFNCGAQWKLDRATINHLFVRYALPISWDFAEGNAIGTLPGSYSICLEKIAIALDALVQWRFPSEVVQTRNESALSRDVSQQVDAIITDPPYYNAIGYAVLMDYFYVWLRRQLSGLSAEFDRAFRMPLTPKWDHEADDGELVDDPSRYDGDSDASKKAYELGMERVFRRCATALVDEGRLVIVFAHKDPDAWEALAAATIRAGFVVDGSWPIQTEQAARMRAQSSAALASSVWLVCRKRRADARPGWDNRVLEEMRNNIRGRLWDYWDAGIRGPDFVWAATGPALEAYSKHPIVKKANDPGQVLSVGDFLAHVRRMVVDFVVGQVLTGEDHSADMAAADRMDAPTAYYLLHRHDFGLDEAPSGACILYSTACGISDRDLEATWNLVAHKGSSTASADDTDDDADPDADPDDDSGSSSGSKLQLKTWAQRKNRSMGYEAPGGQSVPLIDRVHRLMHLWKAGDVGKVDDYLDDNGLRRHELFKRLVQSLIELSPTGSDERKLLESLSNHIQAKGATPRRPSLPFGDDE